MTNAETQLGHVQLRVRDLERSRGFYERLLGWHTRESGRGIAFLGLGPEHHRLALLTVGYDAQAASFAVGLSHVAFEVQSRDAFVDVYRRLTGSGVEVNAFDLGVSWSLYLQDPDKNEIEIYCDTRQTPGGRHAWSGHGEPLSLAAAIERVTAETLAGVSG